MASETPIVIYDANVLFPFHVSHLLTFMAVVRLVQAKWTIDIQREWLSNIAAKRPGELPGCERRCAKMNIAVPEAMVTGYEHLIDRIVFRDIDDRHVIAAALHSRALGIVTRDHHFSQEALRPYNLLAIDPDDLLVGCYDRMPELCVLAVGAAMRTLTKSTPTLAQYLDILIAVNLTKFALKIRAHEPSP